MELTQIRYAIALSEEGTFTGAANRCGIAHPSLTVAIRKLEIEFGQALFDRRPVQLTSFGRCLLPEFHRIVEICDGIKAMALLSTDETYPRSRETLVSAWPPRE